MNHRLTSVCVATVALLLGGALSAADFKFSFETCPGEQLGNVNDVLTIPIVLTLETTNNTETDGAQGWSFGLEVTGATIDKTEVFDPVDPTADRLGCVAGEVCQ